MGQTITDDGCFFCNQISDRFHDSGCMEVNNGIESCREGDNEKLEKMYWQVSIAKNSIRFYRRNELEGQLRRDKMLGDWAPQEACRKAEREDSSAILIEGSEDTY